MGAVQFSSEGPTGHLAGSVLYGPGPIGLNGACDCTLGFWRALEGHKHTITCFIIDILIIVFIGGVPAFGAVFP